MIPRETAASIELPVTPDVAWHALTTAAGVAKGDPGTRWHLEHADVALDTVTAGHAAGGSGRWNGVDFRVAAHLVPMGTRRTMLLLTADDTVGRRTVRTSAANRRARQDLEALARAVGEFVESRSVGKP